MTSTVAALAAAVIGLSFLAPAPTSAQAGPSAYTSATRYDAANRVVGTIAPDPDGAGALTFLAVRNTYNERGQVITVEKGYLAAWQAETIAPANWTGFTVTETAETVYDSMGRKIRDAVFAGGAAYSVTHYRYDLASRLWCTAQRMNPAQWHLFTDACAQQTNGPNGPDRITKNVYDNAGRIVQVRKGVSSSLEQAYVTYSYTPNGQKADIIDANGNRARMVYDTLDRPQFWQFPSTTPVSGFDGSTPAQALATAGPVNVDDYEQYGYDASGNRTSYRKRDGRTLGYVYDPLNRVAIKLVPGGCAPIQRGACPSGQATRTVHYAYDLRGLQTAARYDYPNGGEAVLSAYDGFGRLASSTTTMGGTSRTLSYTYNNNGALIVLAHPDGNRVNYYREGLDRIHYVDANAGFPLFYPPYTADGQVAAIYRWIDSGWRAPTFYLYDGISRPTVIDHLLTDGDGSRTTFAYNPASQITSRTRTGNDYAFAGYVNLNRSYATNGLNQYASAGPATFQYDANGNLISDGTTTYGYDAENRLISSSRGVELRYDPLGRLWQTNGGSAGVTQFLYDGDQLTMEYDGSGNVIRRYVHSGGADDPQVWFEGADLSDRRYLYADHQGSIVAITNGAGRRIAVNAYDEYGIPDARNTGRFQYTGQAWIPELGMYYYKARIYSPTLGRFLQTDPIGYDDQVNLYAYVGNDPMNGRDPDGQYARGTGFEDKEWQRFDKAQQSAANDMEKRAEKLTEKADKLDQKGKEGGDRLRSAAANLRGGAENLRNTSTTAPVANLLSEKDYAALGRREGSQAFTTRDGRTTTFSRGSLGVFGGQGLGSKWIIGHEGLHTIRLRDQLGSNGALAYRGAEQRNLDAFNSIRGTPKEIINPDSLMSWVY